MMLKLGTAKLDVCKISIEFRHLVLQADWKADYFALHKCMLVVKLLPTL